MPSLLLVSGDGAVRRRARELLTEAGFSLATAESFKEGRRLLATTRPDLLIADLRLGDFNGLHLAMWSHFNRPGLPVLITDRRPDPIVERDAAQYGARFMVATADNSGLVDEVQAALDASTGAQATSH